MRNQSRAQAIERTCYRPLHRNCCVSEQGFAFNRHENEDGDTSNACDEQSIVTIREIWATSHPV